MSDRHERGAGNRLERRYATLLRSAAYGAGAVLMAADPAVVSRVWLGVETAAVVVLLAAGAAVAAATGSRRWALAAAVAVLPTQLAAVEHVADPVRAVYFSALAGLVMLVAAAGEPRRAPA